MKKKRIFKSWVVVILGFINLLAILILSADFEDVKIFMTTHVVALLVFIINSVLITKYGNKKLFE